MSGTFEEPELEETYAEWKKLDRQVQLEEARLGHKTDPVYLEIMKRRDELAKKLTLLPDD